jgi:hypothetical protein
VLGSDKWYGTMPRECMAVWIMETTDLEEVIATEEMKAKEEEKKEKKRERKQKKEQKRKERNAELRRRTKAREIAHYDNEAEYYILPRGTRILRRTMRRRAMRLLPPETLRGNA